MLEKQCGLRNYLRQAYGWQKTNSVLVFLNLAKKHANIITQQKFLEKCKINKIIPKSFRFKYHLNTFNETSHTRKVNLLNLNHVLKDKRFQRSQIVKEIDFLKNILCGYLNTYDFQQIISIFKNSFEHVLRLSRERLNQKFLELKREHEKQNISTYKSKHFPRPGVINLSKKELTKEQKNILEKGIKFGLSPKKVPVEEIISKIETGIHMFSKDVKNVDDLRLGVVNILKDFGNFQENLKNKDTKILKELKKDDSLIITKADKSNTIVILEKDDYDSKIETILKDISTYKELNSDPTESYVAKLRKDLEDLKNNQNITPQMYYKFFPRGSVCPRIYGLPKIHKTDIPLRPIVSTRNSPTEKIEKWVAKTLKPLLYLQKSYIKKLSIFKK